jgi:hypothetical protein
MGLTDINAVTSKVFTGNYGTQWLSIADNDHLLEPQVYNKVFHTYGKNAKLVEMLKLFGRTIDVPDADITTIEKSWPQRVVKTKGAVAIGAAGASISIQLHADCINSAGNEVWLVGDVILIPAEFQAATISSSRGYRIHSLSTTTLTDDTALCYPLSNASTLVAASDIDTAIPAGSYLTIAYNAFARGTGQPGGLVDSVTVRTHTSFIQKFTLGLEGNIFNRPYYQLTELGGSGKFTSEKLMEMEFRAQESQGLALFTGEPNDNTSIKETSQFGGSNAVASGMGIYQWADLLGLKHTYAVTPEFADFYTIGQLFASQDITGAVIDWYTGFKFQQDIELAGLDWVKEFSSGSDLYNKVEQRLGFILKAVTLGGLTHVFYNLPEMSKAGGLGLMKAGNYVYEFPEMALGIPREDVSYESFGKSGEPKALPNLVLGYINASGENNRHILKRELGVTGSDSGLDVANEYHGMKYYLMSQFMLVCGECNKWLVFRKSK